MRVLLDDVDLPMVSGSLAAAIDAACDRAAQGGRIVVAGLLDGTLLSESQLTTPDPGGTQGDELRLYSAEPRALVLEALEAAAESLTQAEEAQDAAAAELQRGHTAEAMEPVAVAMDLWRAVHNALSQSAELLNLRLDDISATISQTGPSVAVSAGSLAGVLSELKESLELEDWPRVSDLLTHELSDQVSTWRSVLVVLMGRVRG
jgi:hypothetical protein